MCNNLSAEEDRLPSEEQQRISQEMLEGRNSGNAVTYNSLRKSKNSTSRNRNAM